jgi:endonuclease G
MPTCPADETVLKYMHFSVIMNQQRRLAFVSAVNIDGARRVDINRDEGDSAFRTDERMASELQCANWLYKNNDLDRGHLTRRQDPLWGTEEEVGSTAIQQWGGVMLIGGGAHFLKA